jgi:hypothetical protein
MSYSFYVGDEMVWDPALRVGKLYLGQVATVAEVLDLPSGLTPRLDGTCQIEPQVFAAFFAEFQAWYVKSRHPVLLPLAKGVLVVSLALLQRTGQPPAGAGEAWDEILAEAIPVARHMA